MIGTGRKQKENCKLIVKESQSDINELCLYINIFNVVNMSPPPPPPRIVSTVWLGLAPVPPIGTCGPPSAECFCIYFRFRIFLTSSRQPGVSSNIILQTLPVVPLSLYESIARNKELLWSSWRPARCEGRQRLVEIQILLLASLWVWAGWELITKQREGRNW